MSEKVRVPADDIVKEYKRGKQMTKAEVKGEFVFEERTRRKIGSRELWPNVGFDVAAALVECGVTHAFGAVGGRTWQIADELSRAGIKVITVGHEQNAIYIADAYTQVWRGQKAAAVFCSVSANTYSALQEAFLTASPIIVITVGTEIEHDSLRNTLQECYSYRFHETITKWSVRIMFPWLARQAIVRACKKALAKPTGPVNVEFTPTAMLMKREMLRDTVGGLFAGDLSTEDYWKAEQWLTSWMPEWRYEDTDKPLENAGGSPEEVKKAAEAMAAAKKPFLVMGEWAAWELCDDALREFIEYWSLAFNTRRIGRAVVSEKHPNHLRGFPAHEDIDLMVSVGNKVGFFDEFAAWWPAAIQFADCEHRCYSYIKSKAALVGSLKGSLKSVVEYAKAHNLGPSPEAKENLKRCQELHLASIERRKERAYQFGPEHPRYKDTPHLHFGYCSQIIREVCDEEYDGKPRIMIDGYTMSDFVMAYCIHTRPASCITANDQAGVGHGVGLAMGAAIAQREKGEEEIPVLALMGDSGMLNGGFDIDVAVRERLPIVYWISNNGGWMPGMKYPWYGPNWDTLGAHDVVGTEFQGIPQMGLERPLMKFEKLADVVGAVGMVSEWERDFKAQLSEAMKIAYEQKIPVVMNCIMDSHLVNRAVMSPVYTLMYAHFPYDELPPRGKAVRRHWLPGFLTGLPEEPAVTYPSAWEPLAEDELGYESRMDYFDSTPGYEAPYVEEYRKAGVAKPPIKEFPPVEQE